MIACDTREAWTQFLEFVKKRCSAAAYGNWLSPIEVGEADEEEITLIVPNIFVQDYLISNYKQELCSFLPVREGGEPAINFLIQAPKREAPQPSLAPATESPKPALSTRRSSASQTFG